LKGKVIGIGIGPGDPELITVKAVKTLKIVDVICVPKAHANKRSIALGMLKQILEERETPPEVLELVFPMAKNELGIKTRWLKNAEIVAEKAKAGKVVAFVTLGDPMLYSTFLYLYQSVTEAYADVKLEIIPGVTSVTAAAASARLPLAEKGEVVSIVPSHLDFQLVEETARHADTLVFMKCAHQIKEIAPFLERSGFTENSVIAVVKRCTFPEEKVFVGRLGDVAKWDVAADYFSVAIIKRSEFPVNANEVISHK